MAGILEGTLSLLPVPESNGLATGNGGVSTPHDV
jgi:hypothetical protein